VNVSEIMAELDATYRKGKADRKVILIPETDPTEIVCELGRTVPPEPDQSTAVAIIDRSKPHYHKHTTEVYIVEKNQLTVYVVRRNGSDEATLSRYRLATGEILVIRPGEVHWAEGKAAWVRVVSAPAWSPDDYHLVDLESILAGHLTE